MLVLFIFFFFFLPQKLVKYAASATSFQVQRSENERPHVCLKNTLVCSSFFFPGKWSKQHLLKVRTGTPPHLAGHREHVFSLQM